LMKYWYLREGVGTKGAEDDDIEDEGPDSSVLTAVEKA
jgi:hypothetical protein